MKDRSRIFHLTYALLTHARTYAYAPPIEAWRRNWLHSHKLSELQKLKSRWLLSVFAWITVIINQSRFGIAITIYFRIKYSAKYFCCNAMSYGDIYYLHQLRRSHCLFDRVLFTRARNLYLITRSPCVAQQIKKTWRAKTSRTEYAVKANRIFEKATICGIKEKALILQQPPAYAKTVNLCVYNCIQHLCMW